MQKSSWLLAPLLLLAACSSEHGSSVAMSSAQQLVRFVETGDSTLLRGVFTDSVLKLTSVEEMLATRQDFLDNFGNLKTVDGPEFLTDSAAQMILRYERMSLLAAVEFTKAGRIRFLSIQPEPVKHATAGHSAGDVTDIANFATLRRDFNADSDYVRLVTILSPT